MAADPRHRPLFITHEIYRHSHLGPRHPLSIPRVSVVTDLCDALGWLAPDAVVQAPTASPEELWRFHHPAYIAALQRAEATGTVSREERERFRLGVDGNPLFAEIFRRPATSAGGVMAAARLLARGGIVHCPPGGTHHGRPARASGFCYVNDCVLGILAWRELGLSRIVYLDIDAHHGDGVQDAFAGDPAVLMISVHEAKRWPFSGDAADDAGGNACNLPVPAGFNDSEMRFLLHEVILPRIAAFRPEAIMLQCGADGLAEDPQAKLLLSNNAHREVVASLIGLAPRLLVLGGGGYHPYAVARCWALVWATLNGFHVPEPLPEAAQAVLRGLSYRGLNGRKPPEHWLTRLADAPREGPVRPEIRALAEYVLEERPV